MNNIYNLTRKDLEDYLLSIGEKNIELYKYMNGFI